MYENDVEYFTERTDDQAKLKNALWKDEAMTQYIADIGLKEALYDVTVIHRTTADNCKLNEITSLTDSREWARKALGLNIKARARRQQLRVLVRETFGREAVQEINDLVAEDLYDE